MIVEPIVIREPSIKRDYMKHRHRLPVYSPQTMKGLLLLQQQLFWALVWSLHIKMDETF